MFDLRHGPIVSFHIFTEWSSLSQRVGFVILCASFSALSWNWQPRYGWNLERGELRAGAINGLVSNTHLFRDIDKGIGSMLRWLFSD